MNTKKYTLDALKEIVNNYAVVNIKKKITIAGLIEYSGISKNTWYRCDEIIEYINKMNYNVGTVNISKDTRIPSASELYKSCDGEETKIKAAFTQLLDIIEKMVDEKENIKVGKNDKTPAEYKEEIERLNKIIKEQANIIEKQNRKIHEITFKDDKLINLNDNIEKMNSKTFSEQFGYLLDD